MTLLAAFQALLHRYSGQDDIAVGSPIAGRVAKETEGLVGFFVNTLVMRANLAGDPTFRDLLRQVRQTALNAYDHQELPFEQLVEAVNPERDTSRHPLFQVSFSLQNAPWPETKLAGISFSAIPLDTRTSKFDLSLIMREEREGLSVLAEYSSHLFTSATIRRMLGHFEVLLEGIAADPDLPLSKIPLLTERERRQVLVDWNQTERHDELDVCLDQLLAAQAARTPEAVAAVCEGRSLDYRELECRANRLARHLQNLGVGPNTPVGICLDRSLEYVVGIVGVLKAGGAYVPMDPAYPRDRLALILGDCRAPVVLTTERLRHTLAESCARVVCLDSQWDEIAAHDPGPLLPSAAPHDPAYIIYTSGSTGTPKGVPVTHRNVVHSTAWRFAYYETPPERFLLFPSFAFDSSVAVLFWTLCQGGTLVIPGNDEQRDVVRLAALVRRASRDALAERPLGVRRVVKRGGRPGLGLAAGRDRGGRGVFGRTLPAALPRCPPPRSTTNMVPPKAASGRASIVPRSATSPLRADCRSESRSPGCGPMCSIAIGPPCRSACRANCTSRATALPRAISTGRNLPRSNSFPTPSPPLPKSECTRRAISCDGCPTATWPSWDASTAR